MQPFLTFLTPTYKRPQALARCLASVSCQTAVADIEQIVLPDHIGIGIAGVFERLPRYAAAVHGRYVHILQDDDVLASPTVVEEVRICATQHSEPPIILVRVFKGQWDLPAADPWPPKLAEIDLACLIVRADVWKAHAHCYGPRYEGDYDFADALADEGYDAVECSVRFVHGDIGGGHPGSVEVPVYARHDTV